MLARMLKIGRLLDLYGPLLTDKQRHCMERHYLEDLSLAEIAAELEVSRQAVHDLLRRSEALLEEYEDKLGFFRRIQRQEELLRDLQQCLRGATMSPADAARCQLVLGEIGSTTEATREA